MVDDSTDPGFKNILDAKPLLWELKLEKALWSKRLNTANVALYIIRIGTHSNNFFFSSSFFGKTCNVDVLLTQTTQEKNLFFHKYLLKQNESLSGAR